MEVLIFGNSKTPGIEFTVDPDKGMQIRSGDCYCLDYSGIDGTLNWAQFVRRTTCPTDRPFGGRLGEFFFVKYATQGGDEEDASQAEDFFFGPFKENLCECTGSTTERLFLENYFALAKKRWGDSSFAEVPAIIPQAWVSWLHYRPDDRERAEKIRKQPQRIDFVCLYSRRRIVIEIDGWSHICDNYVSFGSNGVPAEAPSMQKYTEHLKKDRWLRKQGWEVFRFSTVEVENQDIESLLDEIGMLNEIPF